MYPKDRAKKLGKFMKEHRLARSTKEGRVVSQAEICRELGVSSSAYNRWELGDGLPAPENYPNLLAYYGEDIMHILGLTQVAAALIEGDPDLRRLAKIWPSLSSGDRQDLLASAQARADRAGEGSDDHQRKMFQFAS